MAFQNTSITLINDMISEVDQCSAIAPAPSRHEVLNTLAQELRLLVEERTASVSRVARYHVYRALRAAFLEMHSVNPDLSEDEMKNVIKTELQKLVYDDILLAGVLAAVIVEQ